MQFQCSVWFHNLVQFHVFNCSKMFDFTIYVHKHFNMLFNIILFKLIFRFTLNQVQSVGKAFGVEDIQLHDSQFMISISSKQLWNNGAGFVNSNSNSYFHKIHIKIATCTSLGSWTETAHEEKIFGGLQVLRSIANMACIFHLSPITNFHVSAELD